MKTLIQKDLFQDYIKEISERPQCRICGELEPKEFFAEKELIEDKGIFLTCICLVCAAKNHMLDIHGKLKENNF